MSADRLRTLADAAAPGPWVVQKDPPWIAGHITLNDARLIALAPELARWAADAAEAMERIRRWHSSLCPEVIGDGQCRCPVSTWRALLARLPAGDET